MLETTGSYTPRTNAAATAIGSKMYMMGGRGKHSYTKKNNIACDTLVEIFDFETRCWSTGPKLPKGKGNYSIRYAPCAGVVGGRVVLVGGGGLGTLQLHEDGWRKGPGMSGRTIPYAAATNVKV